VNFTTHYCYDDGAMAEREEQATGDWKLSEANESSSRVVDGTNYCSTFEKEAGTSVSTAK
jgi:hypothetical protein